MMATSGSKSYLDLVKECDAYVRVPQLTNHQSHSDGLKLRTNIDNDYFRFPYFYPDPPAYIQRLNTYYHLQVASHPGVTLGYVLPSVALTLSDVPDWQADAENDPLPRRLVLTTAGGETERSAAIAKTTAAWKATNHFQVLAKWRNELYPVYDLNREIVFSVERSASPLLGIVSYGVHLTCYERSKEDPSGLKFWVPRRAKTKQTYPGMLDNTVAGGMATGERPFECLVREAMEEASLPEPFVRANARAAGCVTYFYIRDERAGGETGLLQPECQFVYDMDMTDSNIECKPNDGEVEGFEVMDQAEVKRALAAGEFKPNCALVMVDFLIRHGVIVKEDEPDFLEICARLHRKLEFPLG